MGNGSTHSLSTAGANWQEVDWSVAIKLGQSVKVFLKRNTLASCQVYEDNSLKANHTGVSCNDVTSSAVSVVHANGVSGNTYVYGIEVFNLPAYIIDVGDWDIEPEETVVSIPDCYNLETFMNDLMLESNIEIKSKLFSIRQVLVKIF